MEAITRRSFLVGATATAALAAMGALKPAKAFAADSGSSDYTYEVYYLDDRGDTWYSGSKRVIYLKTEYPTGNYIKLRPVDDEVSITSYITLSSGSGPYDDVEFVDGNSSYGGFYEVEGGWLMSLSIDSEDESLYGQDLDIEIKEYNEDTYSSESTGYGFTVHLLNYDDVEAEWIEDLIDTYTTDDMDSFEKMEAICDFLYSWFRYYYNEPDDGDYLYLASDPYDPNIISGMTNSYNSTYLMVDIAEAIGGFDDIHNCYGDYDVGTSGWYKTHYYVECTIGDETEKYTICPLASTNYLSRDDIEMIDLSDTASLTLASMFYPSTSSSSSDASSSSDDASISYRTHCQTYGTLDWVSDGEKSGTTGESKRLEAIWIKVDSDISGSVKYRVHCQTYGWMDWASDGEMAGTSGKSKRLEAIQIKLTGDLADAYDVYYRVHCQTYGWTGWAKNGAACGSGGLSKRLESIQIRLVEKGGSAPGSTSNTYYTNYNVAYRVHCQTYGWMDYVYDGSSAGTTGSSKRLEGIKIKLSSAIPYSGSITYRTHCQTYGWLDWVGEDELSGTTGESKRLEAIQIKLTGDVADYYDVYYRVHCQTYGWLDWAKNGAAAGTSGLSKRLEAIQIKLVEKGGSAPGSTSEPYIKG